MQSFISRAFKVLFLAATLLPALVHHAWAQTNVIPDSEELAVLKKVYDSLGGAGWTNKTNWPTPGNWPASATSAQFGTWRGITVTNGDITAIALNSNNLVGKIPSNIGVLTKLTSFKAQGNTISGKIPVSIGSLVNLKTLHLYTNKLTGSIPTGVGAMTSLEDVQLQGNLLTGPIPSGFGELTHLVTLSLFANDLGGAIPPALGGASSLQSLHLEGNELTGSIPGALGSLSNLRELMLYSNNLSGSIPAELGTLSSLLTFHLYYNELTGAIPAALGNMSSLQSLKLNNNHLSGAIPASLGDISTLTELDLEFNQLTGSLPPTLGNLSNLTYLSANDNRLSGPLPARLGEMIALRALYLQNNQLEGSIPDALGGMSLLRVFYIYNNSLSGPLPASIGNWTTLTHLYINDNLLNGPLPASLGTLTKVRSFNISNNEFEGVIPSGCEGWTDLVIWSSYNNHFTGTMPANLFANKTALTSVNVSNNQFEGAFPSISLSTALASINASGNRFTTLPAGVLNANALATLNFSNNELTTVPDLINQGNKQGLMFTVSNNRLDFTALELTRNAGIKTVTLLPQKNFKDIASVTPEEGQPLVIPARPAGIGTLAWEKLQADGVTWSNVDGLNQDNEPKTNFRRNAFAKATDEGMYRFSITSSTGSFYQGIVLRSEPIRVKEPLTIVLDDWAFQYRYDGRRRMTHKKVPGAGWVYMVYDDRDRLVLTQDAEQRTSNKWLFTKYDALNRPVMTGIYTHNATLSQDEMSGQISKTDFYETYSTTGSSVYHGYSNTVFPTGSLPNSNLEILTVMYYDNYDFSAGWGQEFAYAPNQIDNQEVNDQTYSQGNAFGSVIGHVTGIKVRSLEAESCWMQTVTYYDDHYRPLQVITDNYKKGVDRVTNIYDFVGKVLAAKTDHLVGTITWQSVVNATIAADKLSKSTTGSAWNTSGASSAEQIPANKNGWVEATVVETNTQRIFGLSESDPDQQYTSVKFGFRQNGTALYARVNGTDYLVPGALASGDKLRIARQGTGPIDSYNGVVSFYKNGIQVYPSGMSTISSTSALIADVAFFSAGATIGRARISSAQGQQQIVERWMVYDHGGRLLETWHKLNGGTKIMLAKNDYNELGQLIDKKLHSTVSTGADAKQSVDYRYNIRGWLTSINNAALTSDANATNDDTNDLFGMNLGYNSGLGISNDPQFNGNISAVQYSKDWGKGDVKQTGYAFKYDPMNRLTDAAHKQLSAPGSWESGGFDEGDIKYDLNGNIEALKRKGKGGVVIDDLKYTYSTPDISPSNKLLYVEDLSTDAANKAKGFVDGNQGANLDYTYDANGNMTRDLNKGIGTSTTDAINVIAYNHLNLPQMVSKGGSTIRYVYDATGRKLAQYVTSGASQKRTDYAGEFIYEDHVLQFVNHEEGRIVVAVTKPVYTYGFDAADTDELTAINAGLGIYESKGEKYVVATASSSSTGSGVSMIGDAVNIDVNQRYRVRIKGYAGGSSPAYLQVRIKSGTNILSTSTALIANGSVNETWIEQVVKTPASGTVLKLEAGVVWNSVAAGERIYLNEFEIVKLETTAPEYQYHLKDHLGNVRLTFTTKEEVETNKATMEASAEATETNQFDRYDDVRTVELSLFDHTNDSNPTSAQGRAIRLSGNEMEKTGLVKTLSVMPGDVINMKVYAKYIDNNRNDWSTTLNNLVGAIANGQAGTAVDGSGYATRGSTPFPYTGLNGTDNSTGLGPKAYLNYIMFDREFNPVVDDPSQSGFVRLTDAAKEDDETIMADPLNGVSHELLEGTVTVKQAGYLYIYLSNEEDSPVEVFFDDFEVVHTKGPVVQGEDYYPFGLTFNGYQRENGVSNRWKFQGQEHVDDLNLGWDSFKWRNHQPEIGRFFNVDPLSEKYYYNSPYAFSENKVVAHRELEGLESVGINGNDVVDAMTPKPETKPGLLDAIGSVASSIRGWLSENMPLPTGGIITMGWGASTSSKDLRQPGKDGVTVVNLDVWNLLEVGMSQSRLEPHSPAKTKEGRTDGKEVFDVGKSQTDNTDVKALDQYKDDGAVKKKDEPEKKNDKSAVPDYVTQDSIKHEVGDSTYYTKNKPN